MGWGNGKNRHGQHARLASMLPMPGKSSRAPPRTPLGPEGPRPLQLAHRTPDRTQPGQLKEFATAQDTNLPPPKPLNSTDAKTFHPHGLRPWDGEWEEPAWAHARFARVSPCWEKAAGLRPAPRWGAPFVFTWSQWARRFGWRLPDPLLLAPDPFSWAHRTFDTTHPGQLRIFALEFEDLLIDSKPIPLCDENFLDHPIALGQQRALHLHRHDGRQWLARRHAILHRHE